MGWVISTIKLIIEAKCPRSNPKDTVRHQHNKHPHYPPEDMHLPCLTGGTFITMRKVLVTTPNKDEERYPHEQHNEWIENNFVYLFHKRVRLSHPR